MLYDDEDEVRHVSFQAALDTALALGPGAKINLTNYTGSAVVRAIEEKKLLPKPHPEGCPCPKCPQDPPLPEGVHLLPPGRVRVSDEDKDRYLDRLRAAYGSGRLTEAEFTARQDAILTSVTFAEMDLLCRDLPVKKEPVTPAKKEEHPARSVFCFLASLAAVCLPVMAGIGIIFGPPASAGMAGVMTLIGGFAALLMVILRFR